MFKIFLILATFLMTGTIHSKILVKDLDFKEFNGQGNLRIKFSGELKDKPQVKIRDNILQVVLKNGVVWPKIERKKRMGKKREELTLMAYQFSKTLVRVRALLPYQIGFSTDDVKVDLNQNNIQVNWPLKNPKKINKIVPKISKKKTVKKSSFDEKYLEKLLNEDFEKEMADKVPAEVKKEEKKKQDTVVSTLSGVKKTTSKGFPLNEYIWKFIIFFFLVVGGFYFFISIFKKGILKKGKVGFLKNSELVSVINTTFIGNKKSLQIVKVHNQLFLLGISDDKISLLSELEDIPGIIKKGEQLITGDNFDDQLEDQEESTQKLKDTTDLKSQLALFENKEKSFIDKNLGQRPKNKISDQIKRKIKGLKPLQ